MFHRLQLEEEEFSHLHIMSWLYVNPGSSRRCAPGSHARLHSHICHFSTTAYSKTRQVITNYLD